MNDGAGLLDALVAFVRRFVVLSEAQADAVALWIVHSHAIEAADCTPYLHVRSATMRSGKTRLLEVLDLLVREPLPVANISEAALFRAIEQLRPTLLMDEVDAVFGPKARDREDLRGLLNAGYRRGAVVRRMGGSRMTTLEAFQVFCAKAFAGIGDLPDTLSDRAIPIRLLPKTREERVERFRRRDADAAAEPLHEWARSWAEHQVPALTELRPDLPDVDDRAADSWEPLLAIADLAGAEWPARARTAARELSGNDKRETESEGVRLLSDIFEVFQSADDRLRTPDLIDELSKIEEAPWGDWFGKPITPQALSKLLQPFQIRTLSIWTEGEKARGYKREQFEDAWRRWPPRVQGGRGGRDGRSFSAGEKSPTTPTGPTGFDVSIPVPGGDGFPDLIDDALQNGHVTEAEWLERQKLHFVLAEAA